MKSSLLRFALPCISLWCVANAATAQDRPFDPLRDLEGYRRVAQGPWADAYALEIFSGLTGTPLAPMLLEDVRKRWLEERVKVDAMVADAPLDAEARMLRRRIARHPALKGLALAEDRSRAPFVLFIQRAGIAEDAKVAQVGELHGAWLGAAHEVVREQLLSPAGARPIAARTSVGVVLLATASIYGKLRPELGSDGWSNTATWDRHERLLVGCDDDHGKRAPHARVMGVVRESVRALLEAHCADASGSLGDLWLEQGLVLRYSQCREEDPAALAKPRPRVDLLGRLARDADGAERKAAAFLPLSRFAGLADASALEQALEDNAKARGAPVLEWNDGVVSAWAQAEAWMHFLMDGREGRRRAGIVRYLGRVLAGERGANALRDALDGEDLSSIEVDFTAWLAETWRAEGGAEQDGGSPFQELYPAADSPESTTAAATPMRPVGRDPGADAEWRWAHAQAFAMAAAGAFQAAKQAYEDLEASGPPEPWASRTSRELARVRDALDWRDIMEGELSSRGATLVLEHGGKPVTLRIESLEDGRLVFAPNKSGLESILLEEVRPADWLRRQFKPGDPLRPMPALLAWLGAMARDRSWQDFPAGPDSEATAALRLDVATWYEEAHEDAAAAKAISQLDGARTPASKSEAELQLSSIESLLEFSGSKLVQLRRDAILRRARVALDAMAGELRPADVLVGEVSEQAEGGIVAKWGFEHFAQLADFAPEVRLGEEHLRAHRTRAVRTSEPAASVEADSLVLRGAGAWSLPLAVEAPYSVSIKFKVDDDPATRGKSTPFVAVLHGAAGPEAWILTEASGSIVERDGRDAAPREVAGTGRWAPGREAALAMHHDGASLKCSVDGKPAGVMTDMRRRGGRICLVVSGDQAVRIDEIQVEGALDPAWWAGARAAWLDKRIRRVSSLVK